MAKILICSLNSQYIHSSLAPWYLLASLESHGGFNAQVMEVTVNEDILKTLDTITAKAPDYLALCCYIWNISRIRELLPLIKKSLPETTIILGGPEVSYDVQEAFDTLPQADYIISGEGEIPFPALMESLINNDDIPENMGISIRKKDRYIISQPYISTQEPPSPYCPQYLEALNNRICYIESSRGCPFTCAFCLSGRCGSARFFDLDKTFENMKLLANSGSKTIKFVDRTFNANKKHAKAIVRYIIDNYGSELPAGVCFHFEIAGDILDDEMIALFNSAPVGSIQLEIGMQSFNEDTLSAVNRKTNTAKLKDNILRLLAPGNIHIHVDLIIGLPLEDMESFRRSFNTAFSLKAHMLQMGFLKILHGAPMDTEPEKYPCTYSKEAPYEVTSTPWMSHEEISSLHLTENALDRLWCSGRFRRTSEYLMEKLGLTPFDYFVRAGIILNGIKTPAAIADALMKEFGSEELRDQMTLDWLSTNASGKLPPALMIHDTRLKKFLLYLEDHPGTRRKKCVKRSAAILYSSCKFIYTDYVPENYDPVKGSYKINYYDFSEVNV